MNKITPMPRKESPVLFSTEMVQAILEGRKTQTRRIVKPQPPSTEYNYLGKTKELSNNRIGYYWSDGKKGNKQGFWPGLNKSLYCQYGQPGDLLWVRESFCVMDSEYFFKASCKYPETLKWKPSIHLPKDYTRIWLEIEDITVERLQDISNEDAIAEGIKVIESDEAYFDYVFDGKNGSYYTAKGSFSSLWSSINGIESWKTNPWVFVVKFKVLSTSGNPATNSQSPFDSLPKNRDRLFAKGDEQPQPETRNTEL